MEIVSGNLIRSNPSSQICLIKTVFPGASDELAQKCIHAVYNRLQ